jgi:hypothetical protein
MAFAGSGGRFDRLTFYRHAFSLPADVGSADRLAATRRTTAELRTLQTRRMLSHRAAGWQQAAGVRTAPSGERLVGQAWVQTVCAAVARTHALAG